MYCRMGMTARCDLAHFTQLLSKAFLTRPLETPSSTLHCSSQRPVGKQEHIIQVC